ncbi:RyR domain protein [compost metagenome]
MAQKTRDGWVYGKEKRPEVKMHPCMVPYDQLPQEQRSKDYLFKAICEEFAVIFCMREQVVQEVAEPEPSRIILA